MLEHSNTAHSQPDVPRESPTTSSPAISTNRRETLKERQEQEQRLWDQEAKLDAEIEQRYSRILESLETKIIAAQNDVQTIQKESAKQWFWERMGSNSGSQIAELQKFAGSLATFRGEFMKKHTEAKQSIFAHARENHLVYLQSLIQTDDHGVPLMDANGEFQSELLRQRPDFAKLRKEYESMEYKLNLAEQGLQYSQTVLEIAASYAGPPGLIAVLLPKYVIQLSTGQSTRQMYLCRFLRMSFPRTSVLENLRRQSCKNWVRMRENSSKLFRPRINQDGRRRP